MDLLNKLTNVTHAAHIKVNELANQKSGILIDQQGTIPDSHDWSRCNDLSDIVLLSRKKWKTRSWKTTMPVLILWSWLKSRAGITDTSLGSQVYNTGLFYQFISAWLWKMQFYLFKSHKNLFLHSNQYLKAMRVNVVAQGSNLWCEFNSWLTDNPLIKRQVFLPLCYVTLFTLFKLWGKSGFIL